MNGAYARNVGMSKATGQYISFLDDDDIYVKERIEVCLKYLKENVEYDAVYTNTIILTKGIVTAEVKAEKSGELQKELLLNKNMLGTGSNIFLSKLAVKKLERLMKILLDIKMLSICYDFLSFLKYWQFRNIW